MGLVVLPADSMQRVAIVGASASIGFVLIGCGDTTEPCSSTSSETDIDNGDRYSRVHSYNIQTEASKECCKTLGDSGWGNTDGGCPFNSWDDASISSYRRTISVNGGECSGTPCHVGDVEGTPIQVSLFGLSDQCCNDYMESYPEEPSCLPAAFPWTKGRSTGIYCRVEALGAEEVTITDLLWSKVLV